jgi:acyl CoA:acetate/3-ketoacid CoA transferase beta subunit
MAETGFYDFDPREGESFIFNLANVATCTMTTGIETILGIMVGARGAGLGLLGAAQIDPAGNINSTMIPGKKYLVGSGGGNDVASACAEVIVITPQHRGRLVDRVDYVTAPGRAVTTLITDLAVYQLKPTPCRLVGVVDQGLGETVDALVRRAVAGCPWQVEVAVEPRLYRVADEDVQQLRAFDPKRRFLGPLQSTHGAAAFQSG